MKLLAVLCIAVANILGGVSYVWQDLALEGLEAPATVALGRTLVAILCLSILVAFRGRPRWRYPVADLLRLAAVGTFAFALPLLLGIIGVQRSTAGNGAILILLEPATILLLSFLILREPIRRVQGVGVCVALAGGVVVVLEGAPLANLFQGEHFEGNLILALHGILWGLYTPLMKPLAEKYSPLDLTFTSMLFSLVLLGPVALWEREAWSSAPDLDGAITYIVIMGVLVSFGTTVLWNQALRWLPAFFVGTFVFLQPVAGLLADYWVLDRAPSGPAVAGAGLIVLGVAHVMWPYRPRRRRPPEKPGPGPAPPQAPIAPA